MKPILTPRELAEAIGVSESSVKRWVDDGSIPATKTSGGHRRIPIDKAVRFIRDNRSVVLRPDLLGLSDVASVAEDFPTAGEETEALFECLLAGEGERVKGLVLTLYLNGHSVGDIVDGPIQGSMRRIGELWEHRPEGVYLEHRATEIVYQALMRLRNLLPTGPGRPIAVGGGAPGDPYFLPSLCVATVLEAAGVEAVNLGADLPLASLEIAIEQLDASLAWLSVTGDTFPADLDDQIQATADSLIDRRIPLVVGGRRSSTLGLRSSGNLHMARQMAEIEAVAHGMHFSGGTALETN